MMQERLLQKARELIAERMERTKLRTDPSLQARHLTDTRRLDVGPRSAAPASVAGFPDRLAAEIVVEGGNVYVVPFLIRVKELCDSGDGIGTSEVFSSGFPYFIPSISGGGPINSSPPPVLSTAASGTVWARFDYTWDKWVMDEPDLGRTREVPFASLDSVTVVASTIGNLSFPPTGDIPYHTESLDIDGNVVLDWATPVGASYYVLMGWWEVGGNPVQSIFGNGVSEFEATFPPTDSARYEYTNVALPTLIVGATV